VHKTLFPNLRLKQRSNSSPLLRTVPQVKEKSVSVVELLKDVDQMVKQPEIEILELGLEQPKSKLRRRVSTQFF